MYPLSLTCKLLEEIVTLPLLKFAELGYGLGIFVQSPPLGFDHNPVGSRLPLLHPPLFPPGLSVGHLPLCLAFGLPVDSGPP